MELTGLDSLTWRKSSYSGTQGTGSCVEVALAPEVVAVRDSKDPEGPVLAVSRTAFARFVGGLR